MDKPLQRHLIVGLGSIGKQHARVLSGNGCDIAGVDPYAAGDYDFQVFSSLTEGWGFSPDMVWLCSPTKCHAEQAVEILEKGCHLFIEKPLAHTLDHARKIINCHKKQQNKSFVWIGCNMRFHPAVIHLKKLLGQGVIGRPLIYRFHFSHWLPNMRPGTDYRKTYAADREGGGIVLDDIHDIDLALHFAGPVRRVSGLSSNSGSLVIEAEDIAGGTLVHENGVVSHIHMDFLRKDKSRGIEIIGEKGSLEWISRWKNPETATISLFPGEKRCKKNVFQQQISDYGALLGQQFRSLCKRYGSETNYEDSLLQGYEAMNIAVHLKKNV